MLYARTVLLALLMTAALSGQSPSPLAGSRKVEVRGTIERVQAAPGQGMPYLELKTEKGIQKVILGSMRYLMEKNFMPRAGSIAVVKGFLTDDAIVAQSVTIPAEKVSIQLRDENGMPLWRMGRHGWKNE
jgi:hypothetical protein